MKKVAILLTIATALPFQAGALERTWRMNASHGVANCQAALPAYETNIRKRPLGIVNEGTTPVYVTCDRESNDMRGDGDGVDIIWVEFANNSATQTINVSCTLVDGYQLEDTSYSTVSEQIAPGGLAMLDWGVNNHFSAPALSCLLPPQAQIKKVIFRYWEVVTPDPV